MRDLAKQQVIDHGWTITHGFFVIMGGLMREDGNEYKVVTINGYDDIELGGVVEKKGIVFPTISLGEITDKAKGDFLSKVVVVIQTSWFVIQCIARHAQGLVVTELELVTLAFATLNVITYFLWWSKPLNAEYPIYFKKDGNRTSGPMKILKGNFGVLDRYSGLWIGWTWERGKSKEGVLQRIQDDMRWESYGVIAWKWLFKKPFLGTFGPLPEMIGEKKFITSHPTYVSSYYGGQLIRSEGFSVFSISSLIGILFGGIHLIGWNFQFSTRIERDMWRISSVIITVFPLILFVVSTLCWLKRRYSRFQGLITVIIAPIYLLTIFIAYALYVPARIVLLVLPFFALRNLPPSAHQNVQLSDYIPHI